jgi:hypothetical protein
MSLAVQIPVAGRSLWERELEARLPGRLPDRQPSDILLCLCPQCYRPAACFLPSGQAVPGQIEPPGGGDQTGGSGGCSAAQRVGGQVDRSSGVSLALPREAAA